MAANQAHGGPLIALIDDDAVALFSIQQTLRLRRYSVKAFDSAEKALAWPELMGADCILSDVRMPGMDGEALLARVVAQPNHPPVIMITGHGDVSMAVRCLKAGAYDFIEKPFEDDVLLASVARAVERNALRRESASLRQQLERAGPGEAGRFGMIGRSPVMEKLYEQISAVARSGAPVLVTGETGVGKELVCRAIHDQSPRAAGPFVPVNAGALPDAMLQSELFGHERGAFTGADRERDGKLVTASGGTLLLDEVESISLPAQIQLLRVLEDGLVCPLGSDKPRRVDIRLLATTKVDLRDEVQKGTLREDFYHRIAVLTVRVPPLRERPSDIPLLVSWFLRQAAERGGMPVPGVPDETLSLMMGHPWPGNVRELRNAVERMLITGEHGMAGPFAGDEAAGADRLLSMPSTAGMLRDELEQTERRTIERVLRECGGEVGATAAALGISRRALYERMRRYDLNRKEFRG